MHSISDIIAIVTGAANGIGAGIVKKLLMEGAKHVRILDVDEASGVALQEELIQAFGDNKAKFVKCDVSNEDQLFGAFSDVTEEYGHIDLLVNNAGVANEDSSVARRREVDINLTATINGTIQVLELMRKDKGGRGGTIINVSSVAALMLMSPVLFVYNATKTGVLYFSSTIGREPYFSITGVRVITVCFGHTETTMACEYKTYDQAIVTHLQDLKAQLPAQSVEAAASGVIEVFKKGDSASTWVIHKGDPALDITPKVTQAYDILSSVLFSS